MQKMHIGGQNLALVFTISAMDEMEKITGSPVDLNDIKDTVIKICKDRQKLIELLAILANEGAAIEDDAKAVDVVWLKKHMRPGHLPKAQIAVLAAVVDGMRIEAAEGEETGEVDLILEELEKKTATTA